MTMRKLLRRRNAVRELLQNLETRPFCEATPAPSGGWLSLPRPRLAYGSRGSSAQSCNSDRR
jgi:hypothetical protein